VEVKRQNCFFFNSHSGGVKSKLGPLGSSATEWPIYCTCPGWLWWWRIWWNEDWHGKPKYSEKTCPKATLSTTNPTWPDPGLNPCRRSGKPATNHLSYGAALNWFVKRPGKNVSFSVCIPEWKWRWVLLIDFHNTEICSSYCFSFSSLYSWHVCHLLHFLYSFFKVCPTYCHTFAYTFWFLHTFLLSRLQHTESWVSPAWDETVFWYFPLNCYCSASP
jgi:hypothetical protein